MLSQTTTMTGPGGVQVLPPPGSEGSLSFAAQTAPPDHMNIDGQNSDSTTKPEDSRERNDGQSISQSDAKKSSQAVSNLLAALQNSQTAAPAATTELDHPVSMSPTRPAASISPVIDAANAPAYPQPTGNYPGSDLLANPPTFANSQFPLIPSFDLPPPPPTPYTQSQQGMDMLNAGFLPPQPEPPQQTIQERREVEAFAKIEFQDGNYYITTWQCELGRDALAYKAACEKAEEVRQNPERAQSSSGRISRPSDRVRRQEDSQIQGSVISEAGGFGGIDEAPVAGDPKSSGHHSQASQVSSSDVVRPQEVLYNPPNVPFDYHGRAEEQIQALDPDYEQPAPVTAEHMPDADQCPIIPIHAMACDLDKEIVVHKSISRRHVRIEWDFDDECFKLKVLGRNGAFLDGEWLQRGVSKRLSSGSHIQISDVEMKFRLPRQRTEPISDDSEDEAMDDAMNRQSTSPTSQEMDGEQSKTRITLTHHASGSQSALPEPLLGPDGLPITRKRGPGRPPKDGIMSTRERREREKAARLAQAKAENGGKTPPPLANRKPIRPPTQAEIAAAEAAKPQEKRKYNKRKRDDEDGDILPSIEGAEENIRHSISGPPTKKGRQSKSPSPDYPPLASLSTEDLQRPTEPYATVIYTLLMKIHPTALPLKGIYRMIKKQYPFYVYCVDSDGWQSSVRHNLNQEWNKLFEKGDKEGKGFAWRAIPGAQHPQIEKKKAAPAPPAPKPKPPIPRQPPQVPGQFPQQSLHWQNNQPYPPHWQGQQGYPPNGYAGMPPRSQLPPNGVHPAQRFPGSHPGTPQPPFARSMGAARDFPIPKYPANAPPLPPPRHGSAASNMPCTLEGIMCMRRFEESMLDQVRRGANPQCLEYWQQCFHSVKARLLHGHMRSNMPAGETQEELNLMGYMMTIRERFKNVNFAGWGNDRRGTPDVHPGITKPPNIGPTTYPTLPNAFNGERRGSDPAIIGSRPGSAHGTGSPMMGVTQPQPQSQYPVQSGPTPARSRSKTASPRPDPSSAIQNGPAASAQSLPSPDPYAAGPQAALSHTAPPPPQSQSQQS